MPKVSKKQVVDGLPMLLVLFAAHNMITCAEDTKTKESKAFELKLKKDVVKYVETQLEDFFNEKVKPELDKLNAKISEKGATQPIVLTTVPATAQPAPVAMQPTMLTTQPSVMATQPTTMPATQPMTIPTGPPLLKLMP